MDTAQGTDGQGVSVTQPSATAVTSGAAPEGFVEKKRLDGALQKIEELTLANRVLTDRVNALTGEKATLMADYGQKESAWTAQQSEFTTKLASAETEKTQLNSELAKSNALKLKLKLINELKAPQLFSVIDVIADGTDEAAMKAQIEKLAGFATQIAQTREKELTAGVTTIVTNPEQTVQLPTTDEGWKALVDGLQFGTPEYQNAMNGWHSWLFTKQS